MSTQIESIVHETHKPEINNLEGFRALFEVPQNEIKTKYRTPLKNAPDEIVGIMTKPLRTSRQILDNAPENAAKRVQEKQYETGKTSLEFFNSFCENLNNVDAFNIGIEGDKLGGITINLKPNSGAFGKLGGEEIDEVSIVIRDGSETDKAAKAYTPMQLNFRFLEQGTESESWRMDMHNVDAAIHRKDLEKNRIEVDATLGGPSYKSEHNPIETLNNQEDPQDAFKALQAAFLINFCTEHLLMEDVVEGKRKIVPSEKANFSEENPNEFRFLKHKFAQAIKLLRADKEDTEDKQ